MRYTLLFALLFLFSMGCAQSKSKPITELSQNDTKDGILIDVRTPEEYDAGHINEAININWYDKNFAQQIESIDKGKTIYLYCKKGGRSSKAQVLLDSLGYTKTINLEGGYDEYSKK